MATTETRPAEGLAGLGTCGCGAVIDQPGQTRCFPCANGNRTRRLHGAPALAVESDVPARRMLRMLMAALEGWRRQEHGAETVERTYALAEKLLEREAAR